MLNGHLTPGGVSDLDFIVMLLVLAVELTNQCQHHQSVVESNLLLKCVN